MRQLILFVIALSLFGARVASAQTPGSPMVATCQYPSPVILNEPPEGTVPDNVAFGFPPGCPVFAGAVVLLESPALSATDPHNWSDIAVFFTPGQQPLPGTPAQIVVFVSDPAENGISDQDLFNAGVPFPTAFFTGLLTTIYIPENPLGPDNPYAPPGAPGTAPIQYDFRSDPPEPPTPAANASWGRVKAVYR